MKKSIAFMVFPFIASSVALAHDLYPAVPGSPVAQHMIDQGREIQPLVSDEDFVFRPYQNPFDEQAFFDSFAPNWGSLKETLMHWSGATGVDPRVILVTVLLTEDWQPDADVNEAQDIQFKEAIKRVANHLSQYFYRYEADTAIPTNASTLAILSTLNDPQRAAAWSQSYLAWFGEPAPKQQSRAQSRAVSTLAPLPALCRCPGSKATAGCRTGRMRTADQAFRFLR
ncbi:hypothetical protein [Photobacterium sp. Hal280]|uniref:hypothetical protein n=1 Tax=Photobacterium sp. Hal280 TaxID=3035163 RepID=UPI00301C68CC